MVAKGLDLPLVTLVGVVSADTALNLPDYRAAERTFQLLAQVAGRAGRGPSGGHVILQTYTPEHYAIQFAAQHDYAGFYARERAFRQQMGYPPFARLVRLVRSDPNQVRCQEKAQDLAHQLEQAIRQHELRTIDLIGPAPCFFKRLRGEWRWQIIARAPHPATDLDRLFNLVSLPAGWQLDRDPLDVL
jgi:primosomal protein N' (replication factor Y)